MPRFFIPHNQFDGDTITITGEDAAHLSYSLRMKVGDEIQLCDGVGTDYRAKLTALNGKTVKATLCECISSHAEMPYRIRLYQSVPKGDKFDYIVQKATELGIFEIVPVYSSRCIVRPGENGDARKIERLSRIAREAAMQSGRGVIPQVLRPVSFAEAISSGWTERRAICYENEHAMTLCTFLTSRCRDINGGDVVSFFVGPEGGYTSDEIRAAEAVGISAIGLGQRILRCETASGFVLACLCYEWEL